MSGNTSVGHILLYSVLSIFVILLGAFWMTYLLFKVRKLRTYHKRSKKNFDTYPNNNYFEYIHIRILKSEENKYLLMLSIVAIETIGGICIWATKFFTNCNLTLKFHENSTNLEDICDEKNIQKYMEISHFSQFGITQTLYVIPNTMFSRV